MRKQTEGVPIAAIRVAEITNGEWRGTGGGIGFGAGGIGLFGGGAGGTMHQETERAKEFKPPKKATRDWFRMMLPLIVIGLFAFIIGDQSRFGKILVGMTEGDPAVPATEFATNLGRFASELFNIEWYLPLLAIPAAVYWLLFQLPKRLEEEDKRLAKAQPGDATREAIYQRLRYVEADNVVFDPISGREVSATNEAIMELINVLIGEQPQLEGAKP
ncbi:MAG: hypothetical protein LBI48_09410 [Burkholderiaceae bacterium]|nr:hypothetical protein [Burkholderiaceae bacterium]